MEDRTKKLTIEDETKKFLCECECIVAIKDTIVKYEIEDYNEILINVKKWINFMIED